MATARKITKLSSIRLASAPSTTKSKRKVIKSSKKIVADGARLMHEGKQLVSNLYKDGNKILHLAGDDVRGYSDEMLKKVQKNPLTSLLVATGVGVVLSLFLHRK
jgi:ElaB/YqjD/DUF883 family membrane-anchored ribosome-binding protein